MKKIALVALASIVGSCAHSPPIASLSNPTCGWNEQTRAMAEETWLYAQLASNVYLNSEGDAADFILPADTRLLDERDNDEIGLAYAVYERRPTGRLAERIIAFRGTEGYLSREGRKDWRYGNFGLAQQRRGLALYDEWRRRTDAEDPRIPIRVAGHSLGGGISIQISLCRENVNTYVFNTSPRFRRCAEPVPNRRVSVAEYGEILKLPRIFGGEATQQYNSIGCTNRGSPIEQHQMRRLAECLTRIAAIDETSDARRSLDLNPTVPKDCWPRGSRRLPTATSRPAEA